MDRLNEEIDGNGAIETWSLQGINKNNISTQVDSWTEWVKRTLNAYERMKKFQIEVNWEIREIYLDNENLRVGSDGWEEQEIKWLGKVKMNPEWDIIELIEWDFSWQQYFLTQESGKREAKKLWKRLPFADDNNPEIQALIRKAWREEFMKDFHLSGEYWNKQKRADFWCDSTKNRCSQYALSNYSWDNRLETCSIWSWAFVRCIKD